MKTILVPTDFSKAANNAAEYATHLAKDIKAKILLFHAYHVPIPASDVPIMVSTEDMQKENEMLLKKEATRLHNLTGVEIKYEATMGFAVDEIIHKKNVELIIMGMRGGGKLSEALIGSVTTDTLRKSKTPVVVIPEKVKYTRPEKIVFACDYDSGTGTKALDVLKDIVKVFNSRVYVVNIKQKKETVNVDEAVARVRLENKLNDVEHMYYFPEKEDLVEGINEFIKSKKADMVAIIPHHYSLMDRLFHRSISKKMAFHTNVPLIALPDNHTSIPAFFL